METRDLDRVRFITQHFNDLQGLRYGVPLGLIALGLGLGGPALPRAVAFLGAFLLLLGAKRYYRNTFGEVEGQPVDPTAELYPVPLFSPAGPISRLEAGRRMPPIAWHFLATAALAVVLFTFFQAARPHILIKGDESLGQHPQILPESAPYFGPHRTGGHLACSMRSPSMQKAIFAQMLYVLHGAFFLGLWLWRERRRSQSLHLSFAVLLLGLSALGISLGSLANGELVRIADLLLPALVYPGVAVLLCGSSMVLAGLLDHWQLVQVLGRPAFQVEV